jgi:hypothetical protein
VSTGVSRFAQQMLDRAAADLPELPTATVTAYTAGLRATVNYQGATLQLKHLSTYTPVVGHVVVLARSGGNWLILGRPVP